MASKQDKHQNLHDSFFKQIFKQQKYLNEFLRVIFPAEVTAYLDLEQMEIQDGELIKRDGKHALWHVSMRIRMCSNAAP